MFGEYHYLLQHIEINLGTKFQLKQPTIISSTKFAQIGYFPSKTEKMSITILHIGINFGVKVHFKHIVLNFLTKFVQKGIFGLKPKSEHRH